MNSLVAFSTFTMLCNHLLYWVLKHFFTQKQNKTKQNKPKPLCPLSSSSLITLIAFCLCSVQFSRSVVSNYLQPHGLQHARLPCLSPTPGAYSNSCPLSQWCHPTISSSVPFISCLQSFPASGSFQRSQLFISGGQSIGVSVSTSVLPMNIQDWFFRMNWLDLFEVQWTLKSILQNHSSKASVLFAIF